MATIAPQPKPRAPAEFRTLADILDRLGVPPHRILFRPYPGTATVEDVVTLEARENRLAELVDGVLVEKAMGFFESSLACVLIHLIWVYLETHPLGIVAGPDGMMRLAPGLVRIPDVSFVSWDQFPDRRVTREPVPSIHPDLAVEVLSQSNTRAEMDRKLGDYFAAGARLVWYLDPADRTVRVFTAPDRVSLVDEAGTLDGGDVLPGFVLPVREWIARAEGPGPGVRAGPG
jgi:Uma2 family endonuclease